MSRTLSGLFDSFGDAERAVRDLEQAGVPHDDISIVAKSDDHHDLPAYSTGNVESAAGAGVPG